MPITPLHFGVLAPVNHFFPGKVSIWSFALINLWMDYEAIFYAAFKVGGPIAHEPMTHSLLAALVFGSILAVFGFRSRKWVLGAYYGGVTHVILDSLVHTDIQPLYPIHWNPFYIGLMEPVSWVLVPLLIWFVIQYVSDARVAIQKAWESSVFSKNRKDF